MEKTIVVDVADDQLRGLAVVGAQRRLVELTHQMLLERFLRRDRIEKELALLFVLLGAGAVAAGLRHVIAPFVVELCQLLELGFEIVVRLRRRGRFFGSVRVGLGGEFFQHRVGFHLLLDEISQLEKRRLEDEQALLKLGRKNLLEGQVL